jgi:hypothetical protein
MTLNAPAQAAGKQRWLERRSGSIFLLALSYRVFLTVVMGLDGSWAGSFF